MATEIISKLKPKNNASFKLMDAFDIELKNGEDLQSYLDKLVIESGGSIDIDTLMDNDIIYYGVSEKEEVNETEILNNFTKLRINPEEETHIIYDTNGEIKYIYLLTPAVLKEPLVGFQDFREIGTGGLDWCAGLEDDIPMDQSYRIIYLPNSIGTSQAYIIKRSDYPLIFDNDDVYFIFDKR